MSIGSSVWSSFGLAGDELRLGAAGALLVALTAWAGWGEVASPASYRHRSRTAGVGAVEGKAFPRTLVEEGGGRVLVPLLPMRVASLTLATDELLLDLLPPERIRAVTWYAASPAFSNVVERARLVDASVRTAGIEEVIALRPDLVFADRYTRSTFLDQSRAAGIAVFRSRDSQDLASIRENLRLVGAAVGAEERAEELIATMDEALRRVRDRVEGAPERPRVLYLGHGVYTRGAGSLTDEQIRLAGGRNAALEMGVEGTAHVALEAAIALDPEVILVPDYSEELGRGATDPALALLADPVWRHTAAVRGGRVHALPGRELDCLSHHAVRAIRSMARILHPGRFGGVEAGSAS